MNSYTPAVQTAAVSTRPAIKGQHLARRFGEVQALDDVSLQINEGEFFSLLGPSGCGKTTLLRLIAGLDFPDAGELTVLGRNAAQWPAHERPVNTVFQSYALFPHLDVFENVAFGLRMKKVPVQPLRERVQRVMEMVRIGALGHRRPDQLSGGQKQRVALARAIVNEPRILLLDEPLGALDLKLRRELQVELHQLQKRLGITFIYVTHDQEEALTMSDRMAVMDHGKIVQVGTPEELYDGPRTRFVARFLGSCNIIEGTVTVGDDGNSRVLLAPSKSSASVRLKVAGLERRNAPEKITLAIRPEKLGLLKAGNARCENQIDATVVDVIYSGAQTTYLLRGAEQDWRSCVFNSLHHHQFTIGEPVALHLPPEALIVLE